MLRLILLLLIAIVLFSACSVTTPPPVWPHGDPWPNRGYHLPSAIVCAPECKI